jgi:nucleotidyltransferase/DNA polymerase involved in DNA repair
MRQKQTFEFVRVHEQRKQDLTSIPGVGPAIARYLSNIGIRTVSDLKGQNPEQLFDRSNEIAGTIQDRCLLYVFRCAVYYAETDQQEREEEKLKWWYWKDK